jgi:hypothetical protein
LAEGYYIAGAKEKGDALLREILATSESKAKYYKTFKGNKHFKLVQPELEESIQIMSYCLQVAQNNQQAVLAKEFNDKINALTAGL